MNGIYNGCVFPTGNVLLDGTLYVYYGATDKYVGVTTCKIEACSTICCQMNASEIICQ